MIRVVKNRVWAFDLEWVPDPLAGRLLYDAADGAGDDRRVMEAMWAEGGASEEDPTPFLKTVLCRIVAVAAVERRVRADGSLSHHLMSLPHDPNDDEQVREANIVGKFLDALGEHRPQLVGFNSIDSDLKILIQRGVVLGLTAPAFCERPDKPWEGIDYFARGSDWNVDLKEVLGGWGKSVPSLNELAVQSGIPGKMDVEGSQVAQLWLEGDRRRIVQYNEFDAVTTYLVWLRLAHFAGHLSSDEYRDEQRQIEGLIEREIEEGRSHLVEYLDEWRRLREIAAARD